MRNTTGCATLSADSATQTVVSPSRQAGRSSRRPGQDHLPGGACSRAAAPSRVVFGFGSDFRATVEIFFEKVSLFPGNQLFVSEGRTQGDGTYISSNVISILCWWSIDNAKGNVTFTIIAVKASFYHSEPETRRGRFERFRNHFEPLKTIF